MAPGSAVRNRNTAGWRSVRIASRDAWPIARASARSSIGRPFAKRYWKRRVPNVMDPRVTKPETRSGPERASNGSSSPSVPRPNTWRIRAARSTAAGASRSSRSEERSEKATREFAIAARVTAAAAARPSASGDARNLRRAGVFENRFSTSTSVPRGRAAGSTGTGAP